MSRSRTSMRWAWAWALVWLSLIESPGLADAGDAARIVIAPLGPLLVGAAASLYVELFLPDDAAPSLLLTSDAEGAAVDVVQGRLMRGDAKAQQGGPLVFRVPIVARGEGQSVVRVRVDAYRCAPRCTPLRIDARAVVEVRRSVP